MTLTISPSSSPFGGEHPALPGHWTGSQRLAGCRLVSLREAPPSPAPPIPTLAHD